MEFERYDPGGEGSQVLVEGGEAGGAGCGSAGEDPGRVTLTFGELPPQPVDDLAIQGVTFDFKVGGADSRDAVFGGRGPGALTFVDDPSLEGDAAGILSLDFEHPTPLLEFGVGLLTLAELSPGLTVELFDAALSPIGPIEVVTTPLASFAEARFRHGGIPVKRAVLDFNQTFAVAIEARDRSAAQGRTSASGAPEARATKACDAPVAESEASQRESLDLLGAQGRISKRLHFGIIRGGSKPVPSLTIKNIPEEVYRLLKERARQHRRSINSEAIECLARVLECVPRDPHELLPRARELRKASTHTLTDLELARSKAEGRP